MAENNNASGRLDSWKDIATYLGRDVRTVMRWEKEKGLPVRRVPGGQRKAIFAYQRDLDDWFSRGEVSRAQPESSPPRSRRNLFLGAAAILVLLLIVVALARRRSVTVDHVTLNARSLIAIDSQGRKLWEYQFPEEVGRASWELANGSRAVLADLEGNGHREVLVAADYSLEDQSLSGVYCFSDNGKLLWHYRPDQVFSFGGRVFQEPWRPLDMIVSPEPGRQTVWLAMGHHGWWPSFVLQLDARGRAFVRFVSSGVIYNLSYIKQRTGAYLLLGGYNNEYRAGALAVLRTDQTEGAVSPQTPGSLYACDNCPKGQPLKYLVFPPSELSKVVLSLSEMYAIPYLGITPVVAVALFSQEVEVQTLDVYPSARTIYEFANNSRLDSLTASFTDGYMLLHHRLEREGKITHSWEQCPARAHPLVVRVWQPDSGWREEGFSVLMSRN
jgi:hypothetical protein